MSKAGEVLAALRSADPLPKNDRGEVIDRIPRLLGLVHQNLPAWATALLQEGQLVAGEVRLRRPDAFAESFDDGSHYICITTGYIQLVYAAVRYFAAQLKVTPDGIDLSPSLSPPDSSMRLASVLWQYQAGLLHGGYTLDVIPCELSPDQESRASELTDAALLFTVLHELGHISIKVNNIPPDSKSEEQEADLFAFAMFLSSRERLYLPWTYAGALFSLRLHDCLEKAGYHFEDKTAAFHDRLTWLQGAIRASCDRPTLKEVVWNRDTLKEVAWIEVVSEMFFGPVQSDLLRLGSIPSPLELLAKLSGREERTRNISNSEARKKLEAMQKKFPVWEKGTDGTPLDRTRWALKTIESLFPDDLKAKIAAHDLVIGEVGQGEAYAKMERFPDGTRMVTISSGMFALLLSAAEFLQLRFKVRRSPTQEVGTISPRGIVVAYISLLMSYSGQGLFNRSTGMFAHPGIWHPDELENELLLVELQWGRINHLTDEQYRLAYELYEGAVAYLLLSRITEALMETWPVVSTEGAASAEEVLTRWSSDKSPQFIGSALAMEIIEHNMPVFGIRKTYAAVLLATRVDRCVALARGLDQEPKDFGPEQVKVGAWNLGESEAIALLKSVGDSYDGLMTLVEEVLKQGMDPLTLQDGPPTVFDPTAEERVWARACIAPLIAGGIYRYVVMSDITAEDVLHKINETTKPMSLQAVEEVAEELLNRLLAGLKAPEDRPEYDDARKEMEFLDSLIERLPDPARRIFESTRQRKLSQIDPKNRP